MNQLPETYVPGFHDETEIRKMKYSKFGSTGISISQIALGAGGFCNFYGQFSIDDCRATVVEALKKGINFIDTAPYYGQGVSEEVLSKCLEGIPRKAYYIATKVGRYEIDTKDPTLMFNFSAKKTKESIDVSLKRLNLDYVDILQIHDVEFAPSLDTIVNETLPAVEDAVKQGKARFIGITGYAVSVLAECVQRSKVHIDSVLSFTRLSMLNQTLEEFLPVFESKQVGVINAAAHCLGLLSSQGSPSWCPVTSEIRDVCNKAREYCKENDIEIGRLASHFANQKLSSKGPHTNLTGMNTPKILRDNLDVYFNGISKKEEGAFNHVLKILSELKKTDWENIEVQKYRALMKSVGK